MQLSGRGGTEPVPLPPPQHVQATPASPIPLPSGPEPSLWSRGLIQPGDWPAPGPQVPG